MNKEQILQAIDETIKPNNKKGITASSLANVLKEMTEFTPEGGGSLDMVKINFPFYMWDYEEGESVVFDKETLEAHITTMEEGYPTIRESKYYQILNNMFQENMDTFNFIKENHNKKDYIYVIDISNVVEGFAWLQSELYEEILGFPMYESLSVTGNMPVLSQITTVKFSQELIDSGIDLMGDGSTEVTAITFEISDFASMELYSDGTMYYYYYGSSNTNNSDSVEVRELRGVAADELTNDDKAYNVETYNKIRAAWDEEPSLQPIITLVGSVCNVLSHNETYARFTLRYSVDLGDRTKCVADLCLYSDGRVEIEKYCDYLDPINIGFESDGILQFETLLSMEIIPLVVINDEATQSVLFSNSLKETETSYVFGFNTQNGIRYVTCSKETGEIVNDEVVSNNHSIVFYYPMNLEYTDDIKNKNIEARNKILNGNSPLSVQYYKYSDEYMQCIPVGYASNGNMVMLTYIDMPLNSLEFVKLIVLEDGTITEFQE